jgi:hypothetical protein
MVNKNTMTDVLEIKLARIVMEFKELGCLVTKDKQLDGSWTVSLSVSEDNSDQSVMGVGYCKGK